MHIDIKFPPGSRQCICTQHCTSGHNTSCFGATSNTTNSNIWYMSKVGVSELGPALVPWMLSIKSLRCGKENSAHTCAMWKNAFEVGGCITWSSPNFVCSHPQTVSHSNLAACWRQLWAAKGRAKLLHKVLLSQKWCLNSNFFFKSLSFWGTSQMQLYIALSCFSYNGRGECLVSEI